MTEIFIVRHGEASWEAESDAERNLTERGIAQADCAARFLAGNVAQMNRIFVSPYTRAQQTAIPILKAFSKDIGETARWLVPSTTAAQTLEGFAVAFASELEQEDGEGYKNKACVFVSHQPLVSSLVAYLVDGTVRTAAKYPMDTASIAHISSENSLPGCAELKGLHHFNDYRLDI